MTKARQSTSKTAAGFTLIETVIAAMMLFIVALIVCQSFAVSSHLFLIGEMQRTADAQANAVVSLLGERKAENLPVGGSLAVTPDPSGGRDDASITDEGCGAGDAYSCDRIIAPDPAATDAPALPAGCAHWPCVLTTANLTDDAPANTRTLLTRAWITNSRDTERNIANVTIAIFAHRPDGERDALLVLRTTNLMMR